MADDKSLASQIKLPELLAALITGALLTPLIVVAYPHLAHHPAPEWLKGAIPEISASLAAVLIVLATRLVHVYATRKSRITPTAKGDRLAIYVASFGNDKASVESRDDVFASIRSNFSSDYVEVLPAGVRYKLSEGVSEEQAAITATAAARTLLAQKGGHILIWGSVRKVDSKTRIELRFVTADPASTPSDRKVYGLTDTLVLDPAFGPEMGATLAAVIASSASFIFENAGRYQKQVLEPITARIKPFAENPPASMRSQDRATLLHIYGTMQSQIGEESSDPVRLNAAIRSFTNAAASLPRKEFPWLWASIQNNLGNTLKTLGFIDSDPALYRKAIDAQHAALEEWTEADFPADWAGSQNNLGNALANLGEKESNIDLLNQAVTAFQNSLRVRPRDTAPFDWAASQANLGDVLRIGAGVETNLAERLKHLHLAEVATCGALDIYTPDYPMYFARLQYNLGTILTDQGELDSTNQRFQQARQSLESALNIFTATSPFEADLTQKQLTRVDLLITQQTLPPDDQLSSPQHDR